ncbi:MAG: imidazole glycerol phosphate synthase subunit HisF, partial [Kurthia sp.]|nr:imidazole glycerol phosphate synthase subunit HisF [Kurthia sp.]
RETMEDVVRQTAATLSIPFTVGGGIRTLEDMKRMLRAGADKVSLNSAALQNPEIIEEGARYFGSQCIVVAMDAKWSEQDNTWMVFTHGGRNRLDVEAVAWAKQAVALGAGELLVTSMDSDGEKKGFDLELMKAIRKEVNVPIIASGGAGNAEHFYTVLEDADADAALAASIFHYKETSVEEVKSYLKNKGVSIR